MLQMWMSVVSMKRVLSNLLVRTVLVHLFARATKDIGGVEMYALVSEMCIDYVYDSHMYIILNAFSLTHL